MSNQFLVCGFSAVLALASVSASAITSQQSGAIDSAIAADSTCVNEPIQEILNGDASLAPDVVEKVMAHNPKCTAIVGSAFTVANEGAIADAQNLDSDPKVLLLRAIANQAVKSGMTQDDVITAALDAGVDITLLFPTAAGGNPADTTPAASRFNRNGNQLDDDPAATVVAPATVVTPATPVSPS